jgi:hypothetical protein
MKQMQDTKSDSFDHFGYEDFDPSLITSPYPTDCPIKDCSTPLISIPCGKGSCPFCPRHGLRLHSNTFVYWNGLERKDEARLRNFWIRQDLAKEIALDSVGKAEVHRLGFEMSEDALTWNVFVGLAEAGKLRLAVKFLTGRDIDAEPSLYLWGKLVDVKNNCRERFGPLDSVRAKLEKGIKNFKTEPDVMLVLDGRLVVCVEAKFGSGNPLAHTGTVKEGEKPIDHEGLLRRYLDPASAQTKQSIDRDAIGDVFHSQLFRNVIFASEMADRADWHVVNLVSETQWKPGRTSKGYSFRDPTPSVLPYLSGEFKERFAFRTWEQLYAEVIKADRDLDSVAKYMRSKSAHYRPAFVLG